MQHYFMLIEGKNINLAPERIMNVNPAGKRTKSNKCHFKERIFKPLKLR